MMDVSKFKNLLGKKQTGTFKEFQPEKLTIQEQSKQFFAPVFGHGKELENIYRSLTGTFQSVILLVGRPACGKTVIVDCIREQCEDVVYFSCENVSGAGIIAELQANKKCKIIIFDEIDKLKTSDQNTLLGLLNTGKIEKRLKGEKITIVLENVKIFATSNSLSRLGKALRSRFLEFHLKEYSDEEFIQVVKFCTKNKNLSDETIELIAKVLVANERKDVRAAKIICDWIRKEDTEDDVLRVIDNWLSSLTNEAVDYN